MEDNLPNKLALLLQNQKLVERINKVFGNFMDLPLNILFQIMDNQELFLTISQNVFRFFVSLSDAIDSKVDSDILLHLGKINLYVLMTQGQYIYVFDEPEISGIYQIILLSEKQKIILLCDQSKEFIDDLIIKIKNSTKYNPNQTKWDHVLQITKMLIPKIFFMVPDKNIILSKIIYSQDLLLISSSSPPHLLLISSSSPPELFI